MINTFLYLYCFQTLLRALKASTCTYTITLLPPSLMFLANGAHKRDDVSTLIGRLINNRCLVSNSWTISKKYNLIHKK